MYQRCRLCRIHNSISNKLEFSPDNVKFVSWRAVHVTKSRTREEKIRITVEPPSNPKTDWIGPPDPRSNIRPYKFYIPDNETPWQQEFRLRREDNRRWNHHFWAKHNDSFYKMKDEFIKKRLEGKQTHGGSEEDSEILTTEEMSQFYKKFLDEKFKIHMQYNKDWYKRNFSLLWPAMKVSLEKIFRRPKSKS